MTRFIVLGDSHTEHVIAPIPARGEAGDIPVIDRSQTHCIFKMEGGASLLRVAMKVASKKLRGALQECTTKDQGESVRRELLIEFESFEIEKAPRSRWRMKRVWGWTDAYVAPKSASKKSIEAKPAPDVIVVYDRADCRHDPLLAYLDRVRHDERQENAQSPVLIVQCRAPKVETSVIRGLPERASLDDKSSGRMHVVAVVHANSLRDAWVDPAPGISTLSCERAALRIQKAFTLPTKESPTFKELFKGVDDLLVVLGASAFVLCRHENNEWSASLVHHTSGVYESRHAVEDRLAYAGLVTVSIAAALAAGTSPGSPMRKANIRRLIEKGAKIAIVRCRRYQSQGLRVLTAKERKDAKTATTAWSNDLLADLDDDEKKDLLEKVVTTRIEQETEWTLLRSCCESALRRAATSSTARDEKLPPGLTIAMTIVERGVEAAETRYKLPVARFGKWTGVDTEEIEGYQSLRRLMWKYVTHPAWTRPLSLAAFGPPGSGKSYGIKQVAASLLADQTGGIRLKPLEFNFGSFTSIGDLHRALHVVRDVTLRGDVPLVMFDEFDAALDGKPHGWLKYLLAPTQDGTFREEGLVFHVRRAIFVFVGGVSPTFDDLAGQIHRRPFVEAKGPDFVSRLRGHVNVRGPDRNGERDDFYVIRRAVLLRGLLEEEFGRDKMEADVVKIHSQIIKAFLTVREYRHGVRSMEAIVQMSDFSDPRNQFAESALPLRDQLEMHTDAFDFLAIVRGEPRKPS